MMNARWMAPALAAAVMLTASHFSAGTAEASKIGSLLGIKQGVLDQGSDVTDLTGKGTNVNLIIAKKFAKFGGSTTTGGKTTGGATGGMTTGTTTCTACVPVCGGGCGSGGALSPTSICLALTVNITINIDININCDITPPPTGSPTTCVCFGF